MRELSEPEKEVITLLHKYEELSLETLESRISYPVYPTQISCLLYGMECDGLILAERIYGILYYKINPECLLC